MYKHKMLLVVGLVVALLAGLWVGASIAFADEPVGNDVFAIFTQDASVAQYTMSTDEPVEECEDCECPQGYAPCRRSDCPCGASWQDCGCIRLVAGDCVCRCWCKCDPCDAVLTPRSIGYAYTVHNTWGSINGKSVFGRSRVGFWGDYPGNYAEYRGWVGFRLGGLPEREVAKATVVLDANTQWLATDENASIVVELVDMGGYGWPRNYYELNWPPAIQELLRLTAGEILEMLYYYEEPLQFQIPPALLKERIARAQQNPNWTLALRLRFDGTPANNLFDVTNAKLYIEWTD